MTLKKKSTKKVTPKPKAPVTAPNVEHGSIPFLTDRQRYSLRCLRDFARPRLASAGADDQNRCARALYWLDDLLDGSGSAEVNGPPPATSATP